MTAWIGSLRFGLGADATAVETATTVAEDASGAGACARACTGAGSADSCGSGGEWARQCGIRAGCTGEAAARLFPRCPREREEARRRKTYPTRRRSAHPRG